MKLTIEEKEALRWLQRSEAQKWPDPTRHAAAMRIIDRLVSETPQAVTPEKIEQWVDRLVYSIGTAKAAGLFQHHKAREVLNSILCDLNVEVTQTDLRIALLDACNLIVNLTVGDSFGASVVGPRIAEWRALADAPVLIRPKEGL